MTDAMDPASPTKDQAWLEIRFLPWRPHPREVGKPDLDNIGDLADLGGDDTGLGCLVALAVLVVWAVAPIVIVALIFALELPLLILLAVLLVVARFAGLIPWTVVIVDPKTGQHLTTKSHNLFRAIRQVRDVNGARRAVVRWAWW